MVNHQLLLAILMTNGYVHMVVMKMVVIVDDGDVYQIDYYTGK